MRKQLLWVASQPLYSMTTLLTPRVWTFRWKTEPRIPATCSHLAFPGTSFKITTSNWALKKLVTSAPNHLITIRSLLPCSLSHAHIHDLGWRIALFPAHCAPGLRSLSNKSCDFNSFVWVYWNCAFNQNGLEFLIPQVGAQMSKQLRADPCVCLLIQQVIICIF